MTMIRRLSALAAAAAAVALAVGGTAAPATAAASSSLSGWISTAVSLSGAQQAASGSGVTVAVIDTGTADLSQFAGQLTEGPSYVSGGSDPGEENHGTGVANLVLQVAPEAHILAIRAISNGTGAETKNLSSCPVGSAISYAAAHGAKVITMSLGNANGDLTGYTGCEAQAVEKALAAGITVLAAAGNNGFSSTTFVDGGGDGNDDESFPAGYTGVITVAALSQSGSHAYFSTVHSFVDVGAPGVEIPTVDENGEAVTEQGTSEATPLVAGVAALILSKAPGLAPYQVAAAIERTASRPGSWNAETGYGEVNATAALAAAEKMTPASPIQASASYTGSTYFAGGSGSGSSAGTTDIGGYLHAGILFVLALISLGGAFLLIRRRRRTAAA
ncbi:MAG TPA: S8 family serine peptidase [Trebonia sp.]